MSVHAKLNLEPRHWYGWQMMPGYFMETVPYFSPIWIHDVLPKKTGRSVLNVQFINVLYAEGVQDFALDLRIIKHEADYLIADILYEGEKTLDRAGIICGMSFGWLRRCCPNLSTALPKDPSGVPEQNDVSRYLSARFELS